MTNSHHCVHNDWSHLCGCPKTSHHYAIQGPHEMRYLDLTDLTGRSARRPGAI